LEEKIKFYPPRWLSWLITIGALLFAVVHIVWPRLAIDAVTITLLVIAIAPWLLPFLTALEFPGGWKITFRQIEKLEARAAEAGLLDPAPSRLEPRFEFERLIDTDPNLALAGLRIELEKRLVKLAEKHDIKVRGGGIRPLLDALRNQRVLTDAASIVLGTLATILNAAVHGATVTRYETEFAIGVGHRILKTLEDLANQSS
jgi:hypothetical protein